MKNFTIEYMTVGSSDTQYAYLTLSRTGRKHFLFWDEWKVTSSDSWYQNLQFEIPENASLSLNGITVEASGYEVNQEEVSEGQKYISVLFVHGNLSDGGYRRGHGALSEADYSEQLWL